MTTIDTKPLRELMQKATPGPWCHFGPHRDAIGYMPDGKYEDVPWYNASKQSDGNDAALIVAMRNELPALLDRIERLERLEEVAEALLRARIDSTNLSRPFMDLAKSLDALARLDAKGEG